MLRIADNTWQVARPAFFDYNASSMTHIHACTCRRQITARDARGVVVTIIADNYFGYCKKETKTQLGYAANLYGLAEEVFVFVLTLLVV